MSEEIKYEPVFGERKFEYGYAGNGIKRKCGCEAPSYLTGEQAVREHQSVKLLRGF